MLKMVSAVSMGDMLVVVAENGVVHALNGEGVWIRLQDVPLEERINAEQKGE